MSDRRQKYRLSRTLKRFVEFRPMEDEHLRYAYAAYKKGGLDALLAPFTEHDMTPPEFRDAFINHAQLYYDDIWVFYANSLRREYEPVGFVGTSRTKVRQPVFIVDTIWFPWASPRNRVESMVNWLNERRKEDIVTEYAQMKDKAFFEHICRHGIMRRVGTKHNFYPDGNAAEFETVRAS